MFTLCIHYVYTMFTLMFMCIQGPNGVAGPAGVPGDAAEAGDPGPQGPPGQRGEPVRNTYT